MVHKLWRPAQYSNDSSRSATLVPEGVWHQRPDGSLGFHPLPPPERRYRAKLAWDDPRHRLVLLAAAMIST